MPCSGKSILRLGRFHLQRPGCGRADPLFNEQLIPDHQIIPLVTNATDVGQALDEVSVSALISVWVSASVLV